MGILGLTMMDGEPLSRCTRTWASGGFNVLGRWTVQAAPAATHPCATSTEIPLAHFCFPQHTSSKKSTKAGKSEAVNQIHLLFLFASQAWNFPRGWGLENLMWCQGDTSWVSSLSGLPFSSGEAHGTCCGDPSFQVKQIFASTCYLLSTHGCGSLCSQELPTRATFYTSCVHVSLE